MLKIVLAFLAFNVYVSFQHHLPSEEEDVETINNLQNYWFAAPNDISNLGHHFRQLLGSKISTIKLPEREDIIVTDGIPGSFDARTNWPKCSSISSIKTQGKCGSCWAIAPATCLDDRLCISTNGKIQISISVENLLSCCTKCVDSRSSGCDGGYADKAYVQFQKVGVVTGGDYLSNEGCQPYEIAKNNTNNAHNIYTPPCQKKCTNKSYRIPYSQDKHYGKTSYSIPQDVAKIQSDIMEYGPVTATFDVYYDFKYYKHGIYVKSCSEKLESHSVKVIGWGTENGVDYWLAANSWDTNWGENGFFRIRRGTNECNFESHITAGITNTNAKFAYVTPEMLDSLNQIIMY